MQTLKMGLAFLLGLGILGQAGAKERGDIALALKKLEPCIVQVSFNQVNEDHTKSSQICIGTVVGKDGLIAFSSDYMLPSVPDDRFVDFKVTVAGQLNQVPLPADFVHRESDLSTALIRISESAMKQLKPKIQIPELVPELKLEPGSELLAFGLLPASYGRSLTFATGQVVKEIKAPQHLFVVTSSLRMDWFAPVSTRKGKIVGFLIPDPLYQRGAGRAPNVIMPVGRVLELVKRPKKKRERSWLGISDLQAVTKDIGKVLGMPAGKGGVIIGRVLEGMPAWKGGLKVEDVITSLGGAEVTVQNESELRAFILQIKNIGIGKVAKMKVFRRGKEVDLAIILEGRPKTEAKAFRLEDKDMGLLLRELVYYDTLYRDLKPNFSGVMVHYVKSGSWSDLGGMQRGDIITKVGGTEIKTNGEQALADFKAIMKRIKESKKDHFVVFVSRGRRGQHSSFIRIEPDWK